MADIKFTDQYFVATEGRNDKRRQDISQQITKAREEKNNCYCVCHSPVSSCASCKHCIGAVEVAHASARTQFSRELVEKIQNLGIITCSLHAPDNYKKDCLYCAKSAGAVFTQDSIINLIKDEK